MLYIPKIFNLKFMTISNGTNVQKLDTFINIFFFKSKGFKELGLQKALPKAKLIGVSFVAWRLSLLI